MEAVTPVFRSPRASLLDAVDPAVAQAFGLFEAADVGNEVGDRVKHQVDLHPGQIGADAEVRSVAEADMRVGVAQDVERERIVEHVFVEVGRGVEHSDTLTLLDVDAADLEITLGSALEGVDRSTPADDLVSGGVRALALVQLPLIGVVEEGVHAVRDGITGGLVAGHGQQDEEEPELGLVEVLALKVGVDQDADDVVGRGLARVSAML